MSACLFLPSQYALDRHEQLGKPALGAEVQLLLPESAEFRGSDHGRRMGLPGKPAESILRLLSSDSSPQVLVPGTTMLLPTAGL